MIETNEIEENPAELAKLLDINRSMASFIDTKHMVSWNDQEMMQEV